MALRWPRNEGTILLSEGGLCALGHYVSEGTDTMPPMEYVLHIAAPVRESSPLHLYWSGAPHQALAWPQSNRTRTAGGVVIAQWVPRFLMHIKTTSLLTVHKKTCCRGPGAGNRRPEKPDCRSSEGGEVAPRLTDIHIVLPKDQANELFFTKGLMP